MVVVVVVVMFFLVRVYCIFLLCLHHAVRKCMNYFWCTEYCLRIPILVLLTVHVNNLSGFLLFWREDMQVVPV